MGRADVPGGGAAESPGSGGDYFSWPYLLRPVRKLVMEEIPTRRWKLPEDKSEAFSYLSTFISRYIIIKGKYCSFSLHHIYLPALVIQIIV